MKKFLRGHYLILGIITGVILGGIVGSFYPEAGVRVGFLGKLFINALKMIVLPLILVTITLSIMKVERLGSLGLKTFVYFISTTALAVILGIVLVNLMHPGVGGAVLTGEIPEIIKGKENMSIVEVLLLEFVSPNLFESAAEFDVLPLIVA
ncbi:MAG: cation:dicarboxylate symporter family transporter, partial [Thermodesulfobacteriota bacterium]